MSIFIKHFRVLWQKPKRIVDLEEDRTVSFLELFYDLAYVVIVIQLTHSLVAHLTLENFLGYVSLYGAVWFAWINGTFYHELHSNNDIRTRIFTFLQMFSLLWMAVFVHSALTPEGYQGFAYAYTGFLATLTYLWWRTGVHDDEHRPLSQPYAIAFLITTGAFLYSTQVSLQLAQQVWFGAIAFSLLLPLIMIAARRKVSQEQLEAAQKIRPSLVERFGLLTIIVLGENLISIVSGATHLKYFTLELVLLVSLSFFIVFSLWWLYFDFISHRKPKQLPNVRIGWMYLHLPLTMSVGLTAVGLLNIVEHPDRFNEIDRWFLIGPIALFLVAVIGIIKTLDIPEENEPVYRKGAMTAFLSAVCTLLLGFSQLSMLPTLILLWILLIFPVFAGFKVWFRRSIQASKES